MARRLSVAWVSGLVPETTTTMSPERTRPVRAAECTASSADSAGVSRSPNTSGPRAPRQRELHRGARFGRQPQQRHGTAGTWPCCVRVKPDRLRQMMACAPQLGGQPRCRLGDAVGHAQVVGGPLVQPAHRQQPVPPRLVVEALVGSLCDACHGPHGVDGIVADSGLAAQHHRRGAVEDGVGDVGRLCAGRHRANAAAIRASAWR